MGTFTVRVPRLASDSLIVFPLGPVLLCVWTNVGFLTKHFISNNGLNSSWETNTQTTVPLCPSPTVYFLQESEGPEGCLNPGPSDPPAKQS